MTEEEILSQFHERQLTAGGAYAERWSGVSAQEMLAGELPAGERHFEQVLYEAGAISEAEVERPDLMREQGWQAPAVYQGIQEQPPVLPPVVKGRMSPLIMDMKKHGGTLMATNGYSQMPDFQAEYSAQQVGLPLLGPVAAVGAVAAVRLLIRGMLTMSVGFFRYLVQRYGAVAVRTAIGVTIFTQLYELMTGGVGDDVKVKIKRRSKRYSIGSNPRMSTLLKVAKRVDNIFISYDSRVRKFRSRIKGPPQRRPAPQYHTITAKHR